MQSQLDTTLDLATVERLSTAFNRCFDRLEVDEDLFAPDVLFDLFPPFWRFQLQGRVAISQQLHALAEGAEQRARILRTVPTASGFVMEHEEEGRRDGRREVARRLWLCEVRDGRITEAVGYCNGGWDDELRTRQAAEAPMVRRDVEAGS
jgi:ketosteroid isomerase-like protein